jgi:DNA repair exonuclease SbcCD ATPase subunit
MSGTVSQVSGSATDTMRMATDGVVPVSSRELFWRARYLRASGSLAHLPFLFWLFADHKPRRTVTLNMNNAVVHFAACQAIDKLNFDALCFGFGEWDGKGVPETINTYNSEQYEEFSQIEEKSPALASKRQPDLSLDLLIAEAPNAPLITSITSDWNSKFSDRAVVMLTDCDALDENGLAALETLEQGRPCLRLDHGGGLRVVLWGNHAPERLLRLAEAEVSHPTILTLSRILSRLGALHVNEWTARDKSAWARRLASSLKQSEDKTATLIADSQSMQVKLDAATEKMSKVANSERRASEELTQSHATINAAKEDIVRLRQWIASLKADLSNLRQATQKDATHQAKIEADLRADAENLQTKLDVSNAETRESKRALTDLREQTAKQEHCAEAEKSALLARVSALQAKLEATHAKVEQNAQTAMLHKAASNKVHEKTQNELIDTKRSLEQMRATLAAQSKTLEVTRENTKEATLRADALQSALHVAHRKGRAFTKALRSMNKKRVVIVSQLQMALAKSEKKTAMANQALQSERQRRRTLEAVQAKTDEARVFHILASDKTQTLATAELGRLSSELSIAKDDLQISKTASQSAEDAYLHTNKLLGDSLMQANETIQTLKSENETQFTQLVDQLAMTEERSIQRSEDLKRVTQTLEKLQYELDPASAQAKILSLEMTIIRLQENTSTQNNGYDSTGISDQQSLIAAHEAEIVRLAEALADARLGVGQHTDTGKLAKTIKDKTLMHHRDEIEELTVMLKETQERFASLTVHNRNLEEARDALLASTSWRVTAPIRQLTTALRRN